jgi:hypothetical protein
MAANPPKMHHNPIRSILHQQAHDLEAPEEVQQKQRKTFQ